MPITFYKINGQSAQVSCDISPTIYDPETFAPMHNILIRFPLELSEGLNGVDLHITPSQAKQVLMEKISEEFDKIVLNYLPYPEHREYVTEELSKVLVLINDTGLKISTEYI
jgi:hypothetical protein